MIITNTTTIETVAEPAPIDNYEKRMEISELACKWAALKYYDQQRVRGVGGDCTFIALVYEDAGLVPHVEVPFYEPDAHLYREGKAYLEIVASYAREIEGPPKIGDLILYKYGMQFAHGAIVIDPGFPNVIHASRKDLCIRYDLHDQGILSQAKEWKFFTLFPDEEAAA